MWFDLFKFLIAGSQFLILISFPLQNILWLTQVSCSLKTESGTHRWCNRTVTLIVVLTYSPVKITGGMQAHAVQTGAAEEWIALGRKVESVSVKTVSIDAYTEENILFSMASTPREIIRCMTSCSSTETSIFLVAIQWLQLGMRNDVCPDAKWR